MHHRLPAALAALAALVAAFAVPAFARTTTTYQDNVTMSDSSCVLAKKSVSHRNTTIVFHVINNGKATHTFRIWGVSLPVQAGSSDDLRVAFHKPRTVHWTCVNTRGLFTIRRS